MTYTNPVNENAYELAIIELFQGMGWNHVYGPDIDRDFKSPLYEEVLQNSLYQINGKRLPEAAIEDAIKKGKLTVKILIEELEQRIGTDGEPGNKFIEELKRKYDKAVGINHMHPDMYAIQNWSVYIQGKALYAVSDSFIEHYDKIMHGEYNNDLFVGTGVDSIMEALGEIANKYVFSSRPIYKLEIAADTIFNSLLDKFVEAAIYYDTDVAMSPLHERLMDLISRDYKKIYDIYSKDRSDNTKLYLRLLLVTDYICGMTDSYAKNLYQELNGIQ